MRIIKEKSRVYKSQAYYKYKINLPEKIMLKSGLKAGDELEVEIKQEGLLLRKRKSENSKT